VFLEKSLVETLFCIDIERNMESVRYSWSGKIVGELGSTIRSQGFSIKEQTLPRPEIRIAFKERVEVIADNCKAFLDPNVARLTCQGEPTEKDQMLKAIIEKEYPHKNSFETAIIYPAILALAVAFALRLLG
jgi:hypothetical protein